MNKTIDDKKCNILWNVDDMKTSHFDPAFISSALPDIIRNMRRFSKMTIMRGKVHKYLGMAIDYSLSGKVILSMIDYIGNMIEDIPEYLKGKSATSEEHHLFGTAEDTTNLSQADANIFHYFVAKLIFLSKKACPDIQLEVSLL